MKRYYFHFFLLFVFFLVLCVNFSVNQSFAYVFKDSPIRDARFPASVLDIKLNNIKLIWNQNYAINPTKEFREYAPLLIKTRTYISDISYNGTIIKVSANISDLKNFLALSRNERKQLVKETLETLLSHLQGAVIYYGTRNIQPSDIELSIDIFPSLINNRDELINMDLPYQLLGVAAFRFYEFIFSENYYLNLKVKNGVAQSAGEDKIIIEKDLD